MLRNTNAKQGSKSKAGEYKLDAWRSENRKHYYEKFRIKRKIRWWIPIDGVAFVFLWWRRAKNERRTGVLALRLWRGNQRRVTLYYISDLSFYKFWECAWKIFERKREEKAMGACVRLIDLRCILLALHLGSYQPSFQTSWVHSPWLASCVVPASSRIIFTSNKTNLWIVSLFFPPFFFFIFLTGFLVFEVFVGL